MFGNFVHPFPKQQGKKKAFPVTKYILQLAEHKLSKLIYVIQFDSPRIKLLILECFRSYFFSKKLCINKLQQTTASALAPCHMSLLLLPILMIKIIIKTRFASSIPDGVNGVLPWFNPSGRTTALGSTQPLNTMSTINLRLGEGGKDGRWVGLTTLPPSCADCLEILGTSTS
jgi:hypothetical protein